MKSTKAPIIGTYWLNKAIEDGKKKKIEQAKENRVEERKSIDPEKTPIQLLKEAREKEKLNWF